MYVSLNIPIHPIPLLLSISGFLEYNHQQENGWEASMHLWTNISTCSHTLMKSQVRLTGQIQERAFRENELFFYGVKCAHVT